MSTITRIEVYKFNIPLQAPVTIAIGTIEEARNILVKIYTSDGLYGTGEGAPFWMIVGETQATAYAAAYDLAKLLIGKNPLDIEGCLAAMDRYLSGNPTVKSAFDMALYDLAAKYANMPLYQFLGGTNRPIVTDETIYIAEPEVMAADAVKIKERGAEAIKVKLGTNAKDDIRRIAAIREAIGDAIPLRTDANQGWDYISALTVLNTIADWNVEYCEQPVKHWDYAHLARLRQNARVPICADESLFSPQDAIKLVTQQAVDFFNIKLSKSGGLRNALKINAIAEAAGIKCMIGCMSESRLGISANAHFASALQNVVFYDLDSPFEHAQNPILGGIHYQNHYQVIIPDLPGHGAEVEEDFLRRMESFVVE
ncbi:mandelate racemase/muconate lactonizing enzyme family protein [Runella salmonicolor]|uniref:Dipeptide epimerase n=1 Tax=Runella salmonicolor TaxID=2950278 RepID=A0ABT1FKJ3_9BACT|nr:dipeptide epimerase [Runella salmonicolor]MCP1381033.1 dipeptide epimerase [Runella salmonicolor]